MVLAVFLSVNLERSTSISDEWQEINLSKNLILLVNFPYWTFLCEFRGRAAGSIYQIRTYSKIWSIQNPLTTLNLFVELVSELAFQLAGILESRAIAPEQFSAVKDHPKCWIYIHIISFTNVETAFVVVRAHFFADTSFFPFLFNCILSNSNPSSSSKRGDWTCE